MSENEPSLRIAVVDDDGAHRGLLRGALEEAGYEVVEGRDGLEAERLAHERLPDAMLLDVRMPNKTGLEALETLRRERPELPVILLTAYIDVRDAVAAIKLGAHDYLEKPIDLDELVVAVDEALGVRRERPAPDEAQPLQLPEGVVAESPAGRDVFRQAERVAGTDVAVLILGESGSGKEVLARYIHDRSGRRGGALVAVNCAALPENLVESELFGHERGAFTGASAAKAGRFEEASGGTLFLDEIGDMPLHLQPKLLRALEDRSIRRVGGTRDLPVDVRLIAASNRPLEDDVRAGRFREDLLYRLNVFGVRIPPLRERREDILPLVDRFLADQGMRGKRFSPAAQRLLAAHDWPGNVRELRNATVRSALMARGSLVMPEDLPEVVRARREAPGTDSTAGRGVLVGDMDEIQKRAILEALEKTGGNKTHAARLLGISRRNLVYKLRSYGL